MGDGTEKNPYTSKDVIDAIARNGGSAWDLDLSEKIFEQAIDLRDLDLSGIILNKAVLLSAKFDGSILKRARLRDATLHLATFNKYNNKVADLREADFSGALLNDTQFRAANLTSAKFGATQESPGTYLFGTDFRGANLFFTQFKNSSLYRCKLEGTHLFAADIYDSNLEGIDWGSYVIGEENKKKFQTAASIYRQLKMWYNNVGIHDTAAKFYYREKEAERKGASRRRDRTAGWFSWAFFGHGEGWKRILIWIAGCILLFTLIYFFIGKFSPNLGTLTPDTFLNGFYYSAVSFITLGYGSWIQNTTGLVKALGVFEAFIGFFMMTLFLVTFVKKWTR
ncbi:MAG: pentapeptide repeat-containing protein [Chloroflexi bacterium]|nr:pentapeptide repeat-containing protein [Chloroflexota bacterium]